MRKYLLFRLLDPKFLKSAQKRLSDSFVIEEGKEIFVGGFASKTFQMEGAELVEEGADVDWEKQWELFAEDFHDGKAHVKCGNKTLLLTPGAGFGDLSHPTTWLMLEMLKKHAKGRNVIDIGTGSGILTLAALLLGAKSAHGIDIDSAAIKHAKENAKLNKLKAHFTKKLPKKIDPNALFLMNMILPEQIVVKPEKIKAKEWIISGILKTQRKEYLKLTKSWGWKLVDEMKKGEWLALQFRVLSDKRARKIAPLKVDIKRQAK